MGRKKFLITCRQCGDKANTCNKIFCSSKCYFENKKAERVEIKCKFCSKVFSVYKNAVDKQWNGITYCSKKCYNSAPKSDEFRKKISKAMSGSKHPNWKGGVMKGRKDRNKAEYKNWRKDVFYRDNYTCQLCKKRGGYLEADHYPIPYSICEMIWGEGKYDIDNGRTLCKECHHGDKKNLHDSLFLFSCDFKQSQLESLLLHK